MLEQGHKKMDGLCQMKQCGMDLQSAQKFIPFFARLSPTGEREHFHSG